jgi:hypothetical protein
MTGTIACTLTSAELRARRAETAAVARRALRSRRPVERGEQLAFAADPVTEAALQALVAVEAECCSFLTLDLRRAGDALELTITGPEEAAPIVAELFAVSGGLSR